MYSLQAIADENKSILLIIEKYVTMSTILLILIERLYIAWEDYKSCERKYIRIYIQIQTLGTILLNNFYNIKD